MPAAIVCEAPYVIDGDSIRCANLGEVRLLGIDAADYRRSRPCVGHFGDHVCDDRLALKAKRSLQAAMHLGPVRIEQHGRDRYGRILGLVSASGQDLSCWQLSRRVVRYIAHYDTARLVRRQCPNLAR
jgi:micrococcal nuclease